MSCCSSKQIRWLKMVRKLMVRKLIVRKVMVRKLIVRKRGNGFLKIDVLFLSKGNLHRVTGADFEALKGVFGRSSLELILKLHECNVVSARYQTNLFESRILHKQHLDELLTCLLWQVREEENRVGWLLNQSWMRNPTLSPPTSTLIFPLLSGWFVWSTHLLPLLEGSFLFGNHVWVTLGECDPLKCTFLVTFLGHFLVFFQSSADCYSPLVCHRREILALNGVHSKHSGGLWISQKLVLSF